MHGLRWGCDASHRTEVARGGRYDNARSEAGVIRFSSRLKGISALIGAGCNARNVRAIKTDIGQFAIAELGQFADIALIVPERLDHADERKQHGSLLEVRFSLYAKPHRWS